jgi:hypothetical protein
VIHFPRTSTGIPDLLAIGRPVCNVIYWPVWAMWNLSLFVYALVLDHRSNDF